MPIKNIKSTVFWARTRFGSAFKMLGTKAPGPGDLLPGLPVNMLTNGVISEGLRRWAIWSLRPVGPETPVGGCCCCCCCPSMVS